MRVLVYGLGKTGTTAIADGILSSLRGHDSVFEPPTLGAVDAGARNLVVKSVRANAWEKDREALASYDKRILVVRHPFDRLLSYLLYDPYNGRGFSNDVVANRYVERVVRKTEDPASVSVRELAELLQSITGVDVVAANARHSRALVMLDHELGTTFHRLRYEDFVDGRRDALHAYLGFALPADIEVRSMFARVGRTKGHGDFHRWFLPSDVEWLRQRHLRYAKHFGYSLELDPALAGPIDPATSYGYVERVLNDYRDKHGLPVFRRGHVAMREEGEHFDRSVELSRKNRLAEAEAELERAVALAPGNAAMRRRLGALRGRMRS